MGRSASGRHHPCAILFGVLYQGGQALSIDMPKSTAT
jgi:hypothetical protein